MSAAAKPDLSKFRDRMDKAVAALKDEFGGLRTGRASATLLEPVHVDAYGSSMPLNQVAAVSVPMAERRPTIEIEHGPKIEQAVSIHGGPFEVYDIHGLEVLQ